MGDERMTGNLLSAALAIWEKVGRPNIPSMIDATLLNPTEPPSASMDVIEYVARSGAYCALISPSHLADPVVRGAAERLGVRLCTVAGFPYGYQPLAVKLAEIDEAAKLGAEEVDYVIDLSRAAAGDLDYISREIMEAARRAKASGVKLKLIVEAPVLDDNTLSFIAEKAIEHDVFMLKTSTGVISKGGDPYTVSRLSRAAGGRIPVKAAGGIKTLFDALLAVAAGASRIGSSSFRRIIEEFEAMRGAH